jgi:hypothetical protein
MQWALLIGFGMVLAGQYGSTYPYSVYAHANFWVDSPALTVIRAGVSFALLTGSYLWTQYGAGAGWSWMQCLGRNSLMVYWIHLALVYGDWTKRLQHLLTIPQASLGTALVTLLMLGMSVLWFGWKARKAARWKAATTVAGAQVAKA